MWYELDTCVRATAPVLVARLCTHSALRRSRQRPGRSPVQLRGQRCDAATRNLHTYDPDYARREMFVRGLSEGS